jgi:hypothetical protein
VLLPDVAFLQAVSRAGGSELCIVLFTVRDAELEFASNETTSCAYALQPASGLSKHECSVCCRDEAPDETGWTESIVQYPSARDNGS